MQNFQFVWHRGLGSGCRAIDAWSRTRFVRVGSDVIKAQGKRGFPPAAGASGESFLKTPKFRTRIKASKSILHCGFSRFRKSNFNRKPVTCQFDHRGKIELSLTSLLLITLLLFQLQIQSGSSCQLKLIRRKFAFTAQKLVFYN